MHTIEIPEANITKYIPSDLSECTREEYMDICELVFRMDVQEISFDDLKIQAVYKLMNMKRKDEKLSVENDLIKFANIHQLSLLIDDFFDENEIGQKVLKQSYIHNPIPHFTPLLRKYFGPADQFENVTFGEYSDALRLFHQFHASGDMELLYHMAAILYRPSKSFHSIRKRSANYDGDIRQKYNPNHVQSRAKVFRYMPVGFIYGVYLYFASFQKFISSAEVPWAGKVLNLSILFQVSSDDAPVDVGHDDIGMDAVMFTLAESGVFGSPKELNNTNIWMVLVRMYDVQLKSLQQKKQEQDAERNQT